MFKLNLIITISGNIVSTASDYLESRLCCSTLLCCIMEFQAAAPNLNTSSQSFAAINCVGYRKQIHRWVNKLEDWIFTLQGVSEAVLDMNYHFLTQKLSSTPLVMHDLLWTQIPNRPQTFTSEEAVGCGPWHGFCKGCHRGCTRETHSVGDNIHRHASAGDETWATLGHLTVTAFKSIGRTIPV
jgi:hypothetical protein